ncbi:hypothetical protein GJAV_G00101080 [Gymnothorax javanicus]|nr:hypothetical protein GJAV_G00101080 [Gymnothorax javanicus]
MSLHLNFLLVFLLTWLSCEVAPKQLTKNARDNAASSDELQHVAGDPNFDAHYPGGLAKQLKNAKSKRPRTHRDDLNEQTILELSLACNDVPTTLSLSERPQNTGSRGFISLDVLESCGHAVSEDQKNATVAVKDCDVTLSGGQCSTRMKYETTDGQLADVTLPCSSVTFPHHAMVPDAVLTLIKGYNVVPLESPPQHARLKAVALILQITPVHTPLMMANFTLDLNKLTTSGALGCVPKIITRSYALFFFPINTCGVRAYKIGETQVFSVEVLTSLSPLPAISGNISRDLQFRLMVECRYTKSPLPDLTNLVSAGFMVKSPSVYPMVQSEGLFSVQLQIAEDGSFKKFYPSYHVPLGVLLGHSVFLQVGIKAANPKVTLLVNYCIAYPRLATKALVLLYDGCPNPLDRDGVSLVKLPGDKHLRRAEIKAFQFMRAPAEYLNEPIYFLCSTELCFGGNCEEGCFAGL